jgi:hypothetical protein
VFGSALNSVAAGDLDVLVVHDPNVCNPEEAYWFHRETTADLEAWTRLPIHITLLTQNEEAGTDFIKRTSALDLREFLVKSDVCAELHGAGKFRSGPNSQR